MPSLVSVKKWCGPRKCCFFASSHLAQRHFDSATALRFLKQQEREEKCICWESGGDGVSQAEQIAPVLEREAFLGLGCNDFTPSPSHAGFFSTSLYCCSTDSVGPVGFFFFLCHFNAATIQRPQDPLTQAWARTLSSFPRFISVRLSFPYILTHSTSSSSSISIFLTFLLFLLSLCFKTSPRLWLSRNIKYQSLAANIKLKSINE